MVGLEDRASFPYNYTVNELNSTSPGILIDMTSMMAARLGLKVQFIAEPWKRSLKSLQRGRIDLLFKASFKVERFQYGRYPMRGDKLDRSRYITKISYYLYTLKESKVSWNSKTQRITNLTKPVGAPLGYSIVDKLKQWGSRKVEESRGTEVDLRKLIQGKLSAVAAQEYPATYFLNRFPKEFKHVIQLKPALVSQNYYMLISYQFYQEYPELSEKIWDELTIIRNLPEYQSIIQRYLNSIP
ncbi:transporter substrate-binding domain-containing protein [Endozoicomonas sp. SM1973]|uniref:Transporter substrate-binding domain-containing protein n=1 Tax=Spartinivicinus marinus TaxID=2994442 RepID=A0A853IBF6_9GAMM|nr:transporter substrate-binding domain-containing protein [Spartinivicinus marinus]MCX4026192.1 transporter substrate-binding domain-containing protein [Spartinivicinus marinus]NYZ67394.1 transporter substrate-binding domain-containing protein [Spartinivicinus marinus]